MSWPGHPRKAGSRTRRSGQRGFLVIAAVFLIVVLAAYAGYLATVARTQHASSAADVQSALAYQASRAGVEWAAHQVLRADSFCYDAVITNPGSGNQNLMFTGTVLESFTATVRCTSNGFTEGGTDVRVYQITSNACNETTSIGCPAPLANCCGNSSTTSSTYVERQTGLTIAE